MTARTNRFSEATISDQKRLARGEQLLVARSCLRFRDEAHNRKWRVMVLAGASPAGEIAAIREVLPTAHITAVDKDHSCVRAAKDAGADETLQVDLTNYVTKGTKGAQVFP